MLPIFAMLGLSEDGKDVDSSSSSTLAVMQAAATEKNSSPPRAGTLSPGKLIEMSEGFASYTAATADVDRDCAGQNAAAAEFVKLFFDPKGSTLRDVLVDETARLGDAATRAALRAFLIENPASQVWARALRTPKDLVDQSPMLNLLPSPLKEALIDHPAALPEILETLVALTNEDERILASTKELRDALGPRIVLPAGNYMRNAAVRQWNDGAAMIPSSTNFNAMSSILTDADFKVVTEQLPGAATLGRRVGASLLRRAAYRANRSTVLPDGIRKTLIDVNTGLADAIDFRPPSSDE